MAVELGSTQVEKPKNRLAPGSSSRGDGIFNGLSFISGILIIILLLAVALVLLVYAIPSMQKFGLGFLTGTVWDAAVNNEFSAGQFIFGTLSTSFIALLIATPIAVGAALYISEYAPRWLATPVSFLIELLAAVPSVIYGFWALAVVVPIMYHVPNKLGAKPEGVMPFLHDTLGQLPLFSTMFGKITGSGRGYFTAGIVLAIMILPTIMAVSREIILTVPQLQKEGMLALGATKWETIRRAVLPFAKAGIIGALGLGLGRALGETMAVAMVIGGSTGNVTGNLFTTGNSMASLIALQFNDATGVFLSAVVEIGLVLLLVSAIVNFLARILVIFSTPDAGSLRS